MTLLALRDAQPRESGGKAAALGTLLRAGVDVPPGVVVPVGEYRRHLARHRLDPASMPPAELRERIVRGRLADDLVQEIDAALRGRGTGFLAVRSSATNEDTAGASAAGQHDSILAVQGTDAVCAAILRCWASLFSDRSLAYRAGSTGAPDAAAEMAVIVQELVDAEVAGVLCTGEERLLEATYGLGDQLVGGEVTPDSWRLGTGGILARRVGSTGQRTDRKGGQLRVREVPRGQQRVMCLDDAQVRAIDDVGRQVTDALEAPADIEWALAGGRIHILQARPITAALPSSPATPPPASPESGLLRGIAASGGTATGTARRLRGPQDFPRVRAGDVLVSRSTDPAWTPLFRIASAVVTETGGVLSHAAIVARELGIPAVLAVPEALREIPDGMTITVDGDGGTVLVGDLT